MFLRESQGRSSAPQNAGETMTFINEGLTAWQQPENNNKVLSLQ